MASWVPLQPNELVKPMLVAALAGMLSGGGPGRAGPRGLLAGALLTAACVACVAVRFDLGGALVLLATAGAMTWVGAGSREARVAWLAASIAGAAGAWALAARHVQAFGYGTPCGLDSRAGAFGLYAGFEHTDGILTAAFVYGGARCVLLVLLALALLLWGGVARARASARLARVVGAGVAAALASQSLLHASAAVWLLPQTGLPLPLVSYGGSSLVAFMTCLGILSNAVLAESNAARASLSGSERA